MSKPKLLFDEVGRWSEIKLEIIKKYASAYSKILSAQRGFQHSYIDGFAGAGVHLSRETRGFIPGSPLNALNVTPPFKHYYLVDLDGGRIQSLRGLIGARSDVTLLEGDCNDVLLQTILPRIQYTRRRRALCLLDPYGLDLDWKVIATAGKLGTIDMFLNFPIMDINRRALWTRPSRTPAHYAAALTRFWGDETWKDAAYHPSAQEDLFGEVDLQKVTNGAVVAAFRNRLRDVAGFRNVPEPMPMKNSTGSDVYYLFFASQNDTANKIIKDIFQKYTKGSR